MPPSSPPPQGSRAFLKRCGRGIKKVFVREAQTPDSRAPSPQPQPRFQPQPSASVPSPHPTPLHSPSPQASAPIHQLALPVQPVPSAGGSTSVVNLAVVSGVSPTTESTLTQAAKKAGADAWTGLKAALRLVEKSSDLFPPLKSAVAGFLGVVDLFETAAQNREDYETLASHLKSVASEFEEYRDARTSTEMSKALQAMSSALEKDLQHVVEQRRRSGFRGHLEAGKDVDDVKKCQRHVETLCRELQNKAALRTWSIVEQQQMEAHLKILNAALQAMYNSNLSTIVGRRACTPGTREAILSGMREWADNPNGPKVYWLNGMAGTGKTTLAYSFCAEMQAAGRSGATFFCSRTDADSRDVSRIVPTIAHQLARLLPSYREVLIRQIGEDKDICARETRVQFEKLIREPLLEVEASVPEGVVVTIDALDECDRRDGAQDVLNVLFLHAQNLPVKFLVTSRPEPGLLDTLEARDEHRRSIFHLHDVEASFVRADITTYLEDELGALSLSREKLGRLAEQAGALFIYAATAVRYIYPKDRRVNSHRCLEDLLSVEVKGMVDQHRGIDSLYTTILAAPFTNQELRKSKKENIRLVLDTAICAREPMSVATTAKLLELDEEDVVCALQHLRSVLHVSQSDDLVSTLHASFPDFMLSRERSKDLYCNSAKHHELITLRCFSTMERLLRFNICELESSFVPDTQVPGLAEKIGKSIPAELLYACRYWPDHLEAVQTRDAVQSALEGLLSSRLPFWMEVLNLTRCIHNAVGGLSRVQAWAQRTSCSVEIQHLARDAAGFITMFSSNPVSRSTPHIYISALPFWPEQRPISKLYSQRMKGLPKATGTGMRRREAAPLAVYTTPGKVYSVAYSSDGTRIVSGSLDKTIRIWDAHTGQMVGQPLEGHTGGVISVAYSPNDSRIVSGSWDETIRIWDAHTGKMVGEPLEGHTGRVTSVAYSPNGARIVSGSWDKIIRIWDAHTGDTIGEPLKGHTYSVNSVAYSSDSARIVSGSWDKTIRIWDAHTGDMIGEPLEGHTSSVNSVAYSPDGARIVSGSGWVGLYAHLGNIEHMIRIWDVHTGKMVGQPLEGRTGGVTSVAYSPNSTRIVSGSADRTIRIWDAHTGKMVGEPLEGHTGRFTLVAYSPDGTHIVSGSLDKTIRVWDAHTDKMIGELLQGHASGVTSLACLSDSLQIVSGSSDNTIRLVTLEHMPNDPSNSWVLDEDGYMRADGSKLLMWVPSDVRDTLMSPRNTAVISTQGSVKIDFTGTHIGESWAQCYSPA